MLKEKIEALTSEINSLIANNLDDIEALRIKYLSRKGAINDLMADFRNVAPEEKRIFGPLINQVKALAFDKINGLRDQLTTQESTDEALDLTRTPYVRWGDAPLFAAFLLLIFTMGVVKYWNDYEQRRQLSL